MKEKIILGLGNNIDYEILWNSAVFEDLILKYGIRNEELGTDIEINSERDLVLSILGFLKSEGGGERFVSSSDIIEEFAKYFEYCVTMGGTSVRAAAAMSKLGYTAALHLVTINGHVRRLIPEGFPYVCSANAESIYPHLIIQFCSGIKVHAADIDICTSRSNRIIYVNDPDNDVMALNEDLRGLISEAEVFLISGFNAMHMEALLDRRLESLLRIMEALPETAQVFYEDACFHKEGFSKRVRDALIGKIGIYSLNEDELQAYLQRSLDLLNPKQMAEALADIHLLIPVPMIIVHTRYWALAYGEHAGAYEKALKGGITMAGTRFCFGDDFTVENYHAMEIGAVQKEGAAFAAEINRMLCDRICCLPSIQADETNATTIGLGDAFVGGFLPALIR